MCPRRHRHGDRIIASSTAAHQSAFVEAIGKDQPEADEGHEQTGGADRIDAEAAEADGRETTETGA